MKTRIRGSRLIGFASFALTGLILAAMVLPFAEFSTTPENIVSGTAYALDGDSLEVAGVEIRLTGIDAPEFVQTCLKSGKEYPCGQTARSRLAVLVSSGKTTCQIVAVDKYQRKLGECRVGKIFVNEKMVADGWAVAYRRFESVEGRARRARRGLWAGSFEKPQAWRDRHKNSH